MGALGVSVALAGGGGHAGTAAQRSGRRARTRARARLYLPAAIPSQIVALVWNLIYLVDAPVARAGVPAMQPPAPAATAATPSAEQQRLLSRSEARADAWVELAPRPPKSGMTPVPPAGAGPLPEEPQAGGHARDPSSVLPPSAAADEAAGSPVVSTAGINASAPVPVVVVELPAGTELRPTSPAEGDVERQPLVMVASPEEANADSNGCGSSGGGSGSESSSDRDGGAGSGSLCTGGRGGNGNQACASHCAAAPHVVLLTDSESTDSDSDCDASATSTALPADEAAGAAPAPPRPVAATLWDPLVLHACCHYGIACFLFVLFNEVVPLLLKAGADKGGYMRAFQRLLAPLAHARLAKQAASASSPRRLAWRWQCRAWPCSSQHCLWPPRPPSGGATCGHTGAPSPCTSARCSQHADTGAAGARC